MTRADSIKPDARIIASDEHMFASAKPLKTGKISERKKEKTFSQKADELSFDKKCRESSQQFHPVSIAIPYKNQKDLKYWQKRTLPYLFACGCKK